MANSYPAFVGPKASAADRKRGKEVREELLSHRRGLHGRPEDASEPTPASSPTGRCPRSPSPSTWTT